MKTKKQDFEDFRQDKLTRKQSATIKAGWDTSGKPPTATTGNGGGTDPSAPTCYYDFEGTLLYCTTTGSH